jgi:2-methylisocitrate lyase-like PEP mutase family enzyme
MKSHRIRPYARVGATMIHAEAVETDEQVRRAMVEIDAPVSITLGEGGAPHC